MIVNQAKAALSKIGKVLAESFIRVFVAQPVYWFGRLTGTIPTPKSMDESFKDMIHSYAWLFGMCIVSPFLANIAAVVYIASSISFLIDLVSKSSTTSVA